MNRSHLPLAIAGVFAIALLAVLAVFLWRSPPPPPTQAELSATYAKGMQYERGSGVTLDYHKALDFYRKAADAGYPPAEFAIGRMTEAGHGVVRDEKAANDWYIRAAEQGFAEAQVQLAGNLLTGTGTADGKPNKIEALKWLQLGADGMPDPLSQQVALATRETLTRELSAEDRIEAGRRTDAWRKQRANPQ